MKKIKLKPNAIKGQSQHRIEKLIGQIALKTKPLVDYYNRLNEREKQIVMFGGIFAVIIVFYLIISAGYDFESSLQKDYTLIQTYQADAEYLIKDYRDIVQLTPNEFNSVDVDRIKKDLAQITDEDPDVGQSAGILTVKVSQAKFSDLMNILNQFRKSYGIFPLKLKITRLSQSGYVSFSASFKVKSQNE